MFNKLYVWYNIKSDTYYYKVYKGTYKRYEIGDKNTYGHKLVLIIDDDILRPVVVKKYVSIRYMVLTPIISLLDKLLMFLQRINK